MLRIGVGIGLVWLTLGGLFAAFLASINIPAIRHIASNEATAVGGITRKNCANHARVFYYFTVTGQPYHGSDSMGLDCARLTDGQTVRVYYDSKHPDRNMLHRPRAALWNEIISAGLAALIFPPFIIWRVTRAFNRSGNRVQK